MIDWSKINLADQDEDGWTRGVETETGRRVRILCTDGPSEYPVCGYVEKGKYPRIWSLTGASTEAEGGDLVPARRRGKVWVTVHEITDRDATVRLTFRLHDRYESAEAYRYRIACIEVPWVEGEGL